MFCKIWATGSYDQDHFANIRQNANKFSALLNLLIFISCHVRKTSYMKDLYNTDS